MKAKFSILILCILLIVPLRNLKAQCVDTNSIYTFSFPTPGNQHTYEIVKELKDWTTAAACALERGGYLAKITSQAEQDSIFSKIQTSGISSSYTSVIDGGGIAYIWIGATDQVSEGNWIWDGTNSGTGANFWNGQGAAGIGGGIAVGGSFVNWGGKSIGVFKEPDNYFYNSDQDAAAIALSGWPSGTTLNGIAGEWNDIAISNTIYYLIEKNSCPTPYLQSVSNITSNSVKVKWSGFSSNYHLRLKQSNNPTWTYFKWCYNDTITLTGLSPNTMFDFQVKGFCYAADTSAYSEIGSFSTLPVGGIELQEINFLQIFPNPVQNSGMLTIENMDLEIEKIVLYDCLGKEVLRNTINPSKAATISVKEIVNGFYFIKIGFTNGTTVIRKIIIE